MSNPLYYVVGLLLAVLYPLGIEPLRFAGEPAGPWAAAGLLGAFSLLAGGVHRRTAPHRLGLARLGLRWLALTLYATLLYLFHFPLWVWGLGFEESVFVGPLLTLSPLLGLFSILALLGARYDPRRQGSFGGAVAFAFRGFAGFSLLPILLMLGMDVAMRWIGPLRRAVFLYPAAEWAFAIGCMLLLIAFLPLLLRVAFGARPLPPGPLRDRMERLCRETGFRCAGILVLRTGGARLANAFIVGIAAPLRYVFFTDAILAGMPPESLECVLAHEIAHSTRRHILSFLAAMLGFTFLNAAALDLFEAAKVPVVLIALLFLGWTAFFWAAVFGWVSRRFESEADLTAARMAPPESEPPYGAARKMAEALGRVAELNRVPPWAWSWRHFSIEKRINLLLDAQADPRSGERFERGCSRWRRAAAAVLLAGIAAAGLLAVRQQAGVATRRAVYEAFERLERGYGLMKGERYGEALAEFRAGVAGGAEPADAWLWIARCERGLGREDEARRAEETARGKGLTDPRDRLRLAP